METMREGHALSFQVVDVEALATQAGAIEAMHAARQTGLVVRRALPEALRQVLVERLLSPALAEQWSQPNAGMTGGEIRTIGDAATPTFTALRGPSVEHYEENARRHAERTGAVIGDSDQVVVEVQRLLSALYGGRPAAPPRFDGELCWAPYNLRALDPGQQIFSHHDNHFGLSVYQRMPAELDRSTVLSWFITLQPPEGGGELVVYGLWGSDSNVPLLPSRFIDTQALEQRFYKYSADLRAGDLVVFDAGRHVHRVTPVQGSRPRLTLGGFMTVATDGSHLAFWS